MALSLLPTVALATEGSVTGITEGVTVTGNNANVTATTVLQWYPKDESIGRPVDGWWIGLKITSPTAMDQETARKVQYTSNGSNAKSFWDAQDSDKNNNENISRYIGVWGLVTEEYLSWNKPFSYNWTFDWDGDKTFEQTVTLTINPSQVILKKDGTQVYPIDSKIHEAKIGNIGYTTLADAIAAATVGQTVTLLKDVTVNSKIEIPTDKTVTLDLNNNKITNGGSLGSSYLLDNKGKLTIKNGTIEDTRKNEAGTITTIENLGTLVIDTMVISRGAGIAVKNDEAGVGHGGVLTVKDSTITASDGANEGQAIQNWGEVTITSGTFNGAVNAWSASDWNPGKTVINGGTFNGAVQSLQWAYGGSWPNGVATTIINSGEFKKTIAVCYQTGGPQPTTGTAKPEGATAGVITVKGGTFSSDPSDYVADSYIAQRNGREGSYTYTVIAKSGLTSGVYMSDPSGFTAANYYVTKNGDEGPWTVYYSAPYIPPTNTTETVKNEDGSTTTTTTDKTTGTVTETTKNTDGSTTTVETKKDGTVTETNKAADGTTGTVVTDKNGNVTEAKASVSTTAAKEAAKTGEAVTLPVEVPAAKTTGDAPAVEITVSKSAGSVKVEIPVEKVTPGTVAVLVKADGTEELVKTSIPVETGVVLKLQGNATVKILDNSKTFNDVWSSDWYGDAVTFVSSHELIRGNGDGTFTPNASMTYGMLNQTLSNLENHSDAAVTDSFTNLTTGTRYGDKPEYTINSEDKINREQMVVTMWERKGCPESTGGVSSLERFVDADKVSNYATNAMSWAVETGLIAGTDNNTLAPQGEATKAQASTVIKRLCINTLQSPSSMIFAD